MASPAQRTRRRRRLKQRRKGKGRRRELRKNPPRILPLDEAPSGAEVRPQREES